MWNMYTIKSLVELFMWLLNYCIIPIVALMITIIIWCALREAGKQSGNEVVDQILREITLNMSEFEAADSEGKEMEGIVNYKNNNYPVFLSWYDDDSYELQAAKQIFNEIKNNGGVK